MDKKSSTTRRNFLKMTAVGAAGLSLGTVGNKPSSAQGTAWAAGKQINPNIPNTRVVSCTDEKMITNSAKAKLSSSFTDTNNQNSYVDAIQVEADMNSMARTLTGKSSTQEAWSTIFMKPQGKEWNAVKAAVKVNCIYTPIMPKIAIVNKVCVELIRLGVTPANITIYDACHGASGEDKYTPFVGKGLPIGVIVSTATQDGVQVPVGSSTLKCSGILAQKTGSTIVYPTDILINCAVNKGHDEGHGGFTMCMKNHTGTLKYSCPSQEEIIQENQCEAIIGGVGGAPCRQQLCIVDSLWAAVTGPFNQPSHLTCTISMGTLAPVVDYQVSQKIRKEVMKAEPNQTIIDNWLTSFNVTKANLEWLVVPPSVTEVLHHVNQENAGKESFRVTIDNGSLRKASVSFDAPPDVRPQSILVQDAKGRLIRNLHYNNRSMALWDGKDQNGYLVPAGKYIVTVKAGTWTNSAAMTVMR